MARQVLPIVGAVIGAYFGQAQLGFAIGSFIGNAVDPLVVQRQGPRLDDLKVTTSAYGNAIPLIKGHPRIAGTIIWNSDRREIVTTTEEQQGKGGPVTETTTYTYEVDLLVVLSANQLRAIRRIWANSKLVWTRAPGLDFQSYFAGDLFARRVTFYDGNDSQLPDPTYEAAVGVGNAPAYRGRSTVFIEGLQLGGGGNLPNLTFEVLENATVSWETPLVGYPDIDTYLANGPIYFDGDGIVQHVRTGYTQGNTDTMIRRLNVDGSSDDIQYFRYELAASWNNLRGTTDASMSYENTGVGQGNLYRPNEGGYPVNLPVDPGGPTFAYSEERFYIGGQSTTFIYRLGDFGAIEATSPSLALDIHSIAAAGSRVYAMCPGTMFVLDATTLALLSTVATPNSSNSSIVLANNFGDVFYLSGVSTPAGPRPMYRLVGASWEVVSTDMGDCAPDIQTAAKRDQLHISGRVIFRTVVPASTPAATYAAFEVAVPVDEPLTDVVSEICQRAGLDASEIDVTGLAGLTVKSLAVASVTSARQVLDLLARAYFFEIVETGGKVKFVQRGGAPVATIAYEDLGVSADGQTSSGDPLPLQRANDDEIPATVTVRYANVENDYQEGAEGSFRLTQGNGDQVLEIALGLTPTEAKRIADCTVTDYGISLNSLGPVRLDRSASAYEPTDVLLLRDRDGSVYRARVEKIDDAGGVRTLQLVLDDASVINSSAVAAGGYVSSSTIALPSSSRMELMDIPILRDADNEPGFYLAMKGAGTNWPGGAYYSSPADDDYTRLGTVTERAVFGTATTTLGNWIGGNVFDESNLITVDVGTGQLASSTRDALLANTGLNVLLVGSEIIQFRTAVLVSAGVYTLSGLLRGRRGTEWAMGAHVASERVVLLQTAGLRRAPMALSDLNLNRYYKAVSFGRTISSAVPKQFANTGIGLKPFAPVDLRIDRITSGDATLTWKRRSRLSMPTSGVVVPPLGEASELYDVEIYDSTYTTLKRTFFGALTASQLYTGAQQVADFGGLQAVIYARVYQRSASVGRGYPLQQPG